MSKMPAKKKSCFQITSVTQAQVAAVGAADDTESLDDPDESRTEEMSSEIYDVSRAEYEPACERSSSDEALNNAGEAEAQPNAPQAAQPSGPGGGTGGEPRKAAAPGSVHGGQHQPGAGATTGAPPATASPGGSTGTSQPAAGSSSAASTVSCSSRFRVIKLDHGTGEPFRRGRWTCTEFYEKDSESSHAARTDSIRHASLTLDAAADRDSGLGPSVGSTVSPATHSGPGVGSMAEGSQCSLPAQQQALHQSLSSQQHGGAPPPQSSMGLLQPQTLLPIGQNGLPLPEGHLQKSPVMPPPYPAQQPLPGVPPITSQSSGLLQHQTEYYQQASVPPGLSGGPPVPVASLSAVSGGHIPVALMPPASLASVVSQVGDVGAAGGGPVPAALQQPLGFGVPGGPVLVAGSPLPHQTAIQYAPAGQPQPVGHPAASGGQSVPAVAAGSSAPTSVPAAVLSASSATMPNVTTTSLPPGQIAHSMTPGALGAQGLPTAGFGQVEASGGRKSEGAAVAQSPVVSGREAAKPFMPDALQLGSPAVTSLFGIHIPVDGEEDRNPSMAFYQAFQSGSRLRDSKAHSDSASGTNIVAIDNKIEQAMDLVKSHLMYAVREEVEVLKEQIKELFERNSVLERENAVLKSLASSEQLSQLSAQTGAAVVAAVVAAPGSAASSSLQQLHPIPQQLHLQPQPQTPLDGGQQPQPNVTSA